MNLNLTEIARTSSCLEDFRQKVENVHDIIEQPHKFYKQERVSAKLQIIWQNKPSSFTAFHKQMTGEQ